MPLKKRIENDLIVAMKARNELGVSVLRFLLSAIKNLEIEKQKELTEEETIQVLQKQVKIRKESITAFTAGGREDLITKERAEIEILNKYLPQQLSSEELEKIVKETIKESNAGSGDSGKVIGAVMVKVKGKADGNQVAEIVKKTLS